MIVRNVFPAPVHKVYQDNARDPNSMQAQMRDGIGPHKDKASAGLSLIRLWLARSIAFT